MPGLHTQSVCYLSFYNLRNVHLIVGPSMTPSIHYSREGSNSLEDVT